MPNYFLTKEFNSPQRQVKEDGSRLQKLFQVGELIAGKPNGYGRLKGKMVHIVLTNEGYVIPADCLKEVKPTHNSANAEEVVEMNSKVSDLIDKDYVKDLVSMSKKSMNGVVIGAFTGFAIALLKNKSVMWFGLIGATAGGLIGYKFSKRGKKEVVKSDTKDSAKENKIESTEIKVEDKAQTKVDYVDDEKDWRDVEK